MVIVNCKWPPNWGQFGIMKVLTWNINGIRASSREIPLKKLLDSLEADIICLQETKITRDQLDEATAIVDGYNAFFSFSRVKGGYSGVATFCKVAYSPTSVEEGLTGILTYGSNSTPVKCYAESLQLTPQELTSLDAEGRAILSEHEVLGSRPLVIVNLYCPRSDRDNKERWTYKQNFYQLVQARCERLLSCERDVLIVGDFNVSHTKLDHCDPEADPEYFASNESRIWMSKFLLPLTKEKCKEEDFKSNSSSQNHNPNTITDTEIFTGPDSLQASNIALHVNERKYFVDLFRYFHPRREHAFTCWSTVTSARKTNYGTRIDYILANERFLEENAVFCDIRPDIHGSDHCPVEAVFSCQIRGSDTVPDLCTLLMPEFKGKQKSIKSFFKAGLPRSNLDTNGTMQLGNDTDSTSSNQGLKVNINLKEGERHAGIKRKAENESDKNPQKVQKIRSRDSKNRKGSTSNLMSYFKKETTNSNDNGNKKEELLAFLNEAEITDGSLREQICKDALLRCEVKGSKIEECMTGGLSRISQTGISDKPEQIDGDLPGGNCKGKDPGCSDAVDYECSNGTKDGITGLSFNSVAKGLSQNNERQGDSRLKWKSILKGPEPPPLCEGHKEECVMRTVKKQGPNLGRQFYCCARPEGRTSDKEARCKTFIWKKK